MSASSRVAPLVSFVHSDSTNRQVQSSKHHLGVHLIRAAKLQLLIVRNALACTLCAVVTNGCYYAGNIFSLQSSANQSLPELLMATLLWTTLSYCAIMLIAHLPSLTTQRFLENPDKRPSVWFCMKKLLKGSSLYFATSIGAMSCLGLLVQHTALMDKFFHYKLHFYLGNLCDLTFTAGITLVVRRIYYKETCAGRHRSIAVNRKSSVNSVSRVYSCRLSSFWRKYLTKAPRVFTTPSSPSVLPPSPRFWRVYLQKTPEALLVVLAGGYVHAVSSYKLVERGQVVVLLFAVLSILLKLVVQEAARWYIVKNRVRSIHVMCVIVGVPTVLIDTQARIVLLGTNTSKILVSGTLCMALAEFCLRGAKALLIMRSIRHRAKAFKSKHQINCPKTQRLASNSLEFETWRRQVLAYHTAELAADMYAEYIAIGCSQSLVFWFVDHPFYPSLRLQPTSRDQSQVTMFGFQFLVEVVVDYSCIVMEMVIGIEFNRTKGLSTFLGVVFMTLAVLTINIPATIYLE